MSLYSITWEYKIKPNFFCESTIKRKSFVNMLVLNEYS